MWANFAVAAFLIYVAIMPNPPGWFGEQLFKIKILPWPVVDGLMIFVACLNIYEGIKTLVIN